MREASSNGHGDGTSTDGAGSESDRLRADIDATHRRLEGLLGELDRRRREAFDVRLQMRRHPAAFAVGAALALGALGGGTTLVIARVRRRRRYLRSPSARLSRLWQISGRRDLKPRSGASSMAGSVATRALQVGVAILVRQLASRALGKRVKD